MPLACLLVSVAALAASPGIGDGLSDKLGSFEAVLDEIHAVRLSGKWSQPGWRSELIESYLKDLLAAVSQATGRVNLKLPIDLHSLKPAPLNRKLVTHEGRLHVVENAKLSPPVRSLILADGNVNMLRAEHCVILARGAVRIVRSCDNIILAGHYIDILADDSTPSRRRNDADEVEPGSLIMSGEMLRIGNARRTICCGLRRLEFIFPTGADVICLNSPRPQMKHQRNGSPLSQVTNAPIPFFYKDEHNPLTGRFHIVRWTPSSLVLREGNSEYQLPLSSELKSFNGSSLPGLEGWKLCFVDSHYALFTNGTQYAGFSPGP